MVAVVVESEDGDEREDQRPGVSEKPLSRRVAVDRQAQIGLALGPAVEGLGAHASALRARMSSTRSI